MQALIEGVPQKFLVELDGIVSEEYGGAPRRQSPKDLTDHLVVRDTLRTQKLRDRGSGNMERARRWHNVREKSAAQLEALDLAQVGIGLDRPEMQNLIKAFNKARRFHIVDDETQTRTPSIDLKAESHCGFTHPKTLREGGNHRVVLKVDRLTL